MVGRKEIEAAEAPLPLFIAAGLVSWLQDWKGLAGIFATTSYDNFLSCSIIASITITSIIMIAIAILLVGCAILGPNHSAVNYHKEQLAKRCESLLNDEELQVPFCCTYRYFHTVTRMAGDEVDPFVARVAPCE